MSISVLEAAVLSYIVYLDKKNNVAANGSWRVEDYLVLDNTIKQYSTSYDSWSVVDDICNDNLGFRCIIFKKGDYQVACYRGTKVGIGSVEEMNAACDLCILSPAYRSTDSSLSRLLDYVCCAVIPKVAYVKMHIGHSLGGFLAELVSSLQNDGECKTFDSLGTNEEGIRSLITLPYLTESSVSSPSKKMHFSVDPNAANTTNPVNGVRYVIGDYYKSYNSAEANVNKEGRDMNELRDIIKLKETHPLMSFIDQIKQNVYHQVQEWPVTKYPYKNVSCCSFLSRWKRRWFGHSMINIVSDIDGFDRFRSGELVVFARDLKETDLEVDITETLPPRSK